MKFFNDSQEVLKYLIFNTYINREKVKKIKMLQIERYGQTDKTER